MGFLSKDTLSDYKRRVQVGIYIVVFIFFLLFLRLFYLQIFKGGKFLEFSEKNRISVKTVKALRGKILDRYGDVLADNRPSFDLSVIRGYVRDDLGSFVKKTSDFLEWNLDESSFKGIIKKLKSANRYDPTVIKKDISRDELAKSVAREYWLTGMKILEQPVRIYPHGELLSHALGYMSEIGKNSLGKMKETENKIYGLGDYVGQSGIEKLLESKLRGVNGATPVIENASGREIGEEIKGELLPAFRKKDPLPGDNVYLTIDLELQKIAEEAFDGKAGGVVVMNPFSGEILALLSKPSFSPGLFTRGVPQEYWRELMKNPKNPLYDRALRGHYPPGSTFKIVTAIAALSEGVIDSDFSFYCKGSYRLGRETKRCWKKSGHGLLNLRGAIVHSCDVYFYELGNRLGIDAIAKYARMLGLGSRTGIDINYEDKGLVPDTKWKQKVFKQDWVGGETLSVAVGQGFLTATPIQMASMLSAVVNGGKLYKSSLVKKVEDYQGETVWEFKPQVRSEFKIDKEILDKVKNALLGVVNEQGGTAYWTVRSKYLDIAGKTGTAQVVKLDSVNKNIEEHGDHAWFIAFAPYENPKIVVSVLVEHGGHGSSAAGPIAKKIIEGYYKRRINVEGI